MQDLNPALLKLARPSGAKHRWWALQPPLPLRPLAPPQPVLPPRLLTEPIGMVSASLVGMPYAIASLIGQYLAPQELPVLIHTSLATRWAAHQDVRYVERKRYRAASRARDESTTYQVSDGLACRAFYATCIEIAHARAARGEAHALYPAMREAQRLAELPELSAASYASERLLVEAAAGWALDAGSAWRIHEWNWRVREAQRAGRAPMPLLDPADRLRDELESLRKRLAYVITADLRRFNEFADEPSRRQCPIHYIEHFADEPFEPGDMIEQTHRFDDGQLQTQRQPRPDPAADETMVRFKFGPDSVLGVVYVHVFNLPKADLDMNAPD
ncbi:hypothetical protein [Caenimonas koreensis]|uniref:hypothetical protein n=1 Tax=Caenimonas koreensis TaxID=367474 RepID=UPI0037838F39